METNWKTKNVQNQHSTYLKLVKKIYYENNKSMQYKGTMESLLREFFSRTSKKKYTWKRDVFKRLLVHLYSQKCYAILRDYNSVAVLHNISSFGNKIVRNVEDWKNEYLTKEEQLSAIIKHCFTMYETPSFLENSFFGCDKKSMLWYIQLGKGKSIKELSQMPINLTSKMAHEFRNAPSYMSVNEALRYAQALGFGASTPIARKIGNSRLSVIRQEQESFWASVVHFFAREEKLNVSEVDMIVDYLTFKYRENPWYSMKNRTLSALLHQTQEWHRSVYFDRKGGFLEWKSLGIQALFVEEFIDHKKVVYKTVELLNSIQLYDEGNAMQHCVAEYDTDCQNKRCAIFSLQKEVEGEPIKRLVTLEIGLPEYQIRQAKAKYNEEPDAKSLELINHWINNSQIRRTKEMDYETPYQHQLNVRPVRNVMQSAESYDTVDVLKVLVWILYIIIKMMLISR
ncbi:PcfJ domain-containing protein [Aquimarina sp. 433]